MADKEAEPRKHRILGWRGVLAEGNRAMRVTVYFLLLLSCVALTFTQLGFFGIEIDESTSAYAVLLLLPISLAALGYGMWLGALAGLVAGSVLYAHALVMPLDYYELSFVTPFSSIFSLTVSGLVLGLLFAIALRNDPPRVRRVFYIIVICVLVSCSFSNLFMFNALTELVQNVAKSGITDYTSDAFDDTLTINAAEMVMRLGDMTFQIVIDATLMALFCVIGDVASRRAIAKQRGLGLRALLGAWLMAVVVAAFMVTSVLSFASITEGERVSAADAMTTKAAYLCNQLGGYDDRAVALMRYLDTLEVENYGLTDENIGELIEAVSIEHLLDGYEMSADGTIVITQGTSQVAMSNNGDRFPAHEPLSDAVNSEIITSISSSLATGEVKRVIYDGLSPKAMKEGPSKYIENSEKTTIAYLYSEKTDSNVVTIIWPASKVFENRQTVMAWTTVSELVLLAAVSLLVFFLLSRVFVRRVNEINETLGRISEGDLNAVVDVKDTREFTLLSAGINETVGTLKGWIAEAETRMATELATAKVIQESVLPSVFPPFPGINRFDIYALMNAAREVGGDFYDFFLIGDDSGSDSGKLGFVIADVSGKGVPAALFMMNAKAHIRGYMESGMELGEAIENANRHLCAENKEGMFVTLFAGVLDYGTYHVDYVNAGHNPPLLWQDGAWRWVEDKSGLPLGLFDGLPYTAYSVECGIGDQFLLYTDGVTEAMNVEDELYGESRLKELADRDFTLHPRMLVDSVRRDVAEHAKGAVRSDDITILALEVGVPPEITATLAVKADVAELPRVNDFIHTELDRRLCPVRAQSQLDIAVEELFVNVAHYAYPDAAPDNPGMAWISYAYVADPPSITVDIIDEGIPYDPLAKPDAVTPDDIMEVPIGGLGILMAKKSVDEMRYERVDGTNVVSIVKRW